MSQRSVKGVRDNMWDNDDNEFTQQSLVISNRWQGEDEDLDVKDSWDEPEEEKKEEKDDVSKTAAATKKPKKALLGKIEEKERKRREELERKKYEQDLSEMTPEELRAEKLRRQKLQEEADLVVAKELLGANDFISSSSTLDSKEDFEKFKDDIVKQLGESTKNQNFPNFVEQLVQSLCVQLTAADLKKIHTWIGNLQIEKLKIEKGDKAKKNKGKGKAKLKLEGDTAYNEFSAYTEDYDDFM